MFEKWLIQEEEKISRYREEINAVNERTNADLATKEAEIKLEIVKEKEKAATANAKKLKLIEQKAQEPQIENLNILITEKQDLITQLNKDSKVKEDANRLAFNKKIADLETRKSEITQKIDREKNAVLGEGGIDEKIKRFRKKITDINNTLRREAEKNQVYRFAKKWFGKDDILEIKEKELAFISAIWFGSIALICATVGTILALISNIMRDPEAFKEKQKMRRATPVRRSIRLMMLALRRRLNKPKIVEKPVEVEKIVEVEKEVEKEVEIIKEVIKEVPVDRLVEVEKEVPVEKIAIKEVPVEIVRKELVHVPFYSTESGYVDATSALKNSEIPIHSVEEKNLVQQEVFDGEGKEIPNFESMTKTKIVEWAKANKLLINGRKTKAELIKNIKSQLP